MSINSKARREAKKRKAAKANASRPPGPAIEPHAELRDASGRLLAGIVRRAGVWVLGMDDRIAGSTDSAAEVLVMIQRAAALHEAQGIPVRLVYSDELRDDAHLEAATQGMDFDQYAATLQREMEAGKAPADDVPQAGEGDAASGDAAPE